MIIRWASSTVRGSFIHAGFLYKANPDGEYILGFNETKVRGSSGFKEVWNIDFLIDILSAPRRDTSWGFLNWEAFQSQNKPCTTLLKCSL
jgi:hypothetical protein